MSNLALPCTCKLCRNIIGHFSLEWPPPKDNAASEAQNQQQFGTLCRALSDHLQKEAQAGRREHAAALASSIAIGGNASMLMVARHFSLPEGAQGFFEDSRRALHNMSRAFRMTDADLEMLAEATNERIECPSDETDDDDYSQIQRRNKQAIVELLRSLRDQYEEGAAPVKEAKAIIV